MGNTSGSIALVALAPTPLTTAVFQAHASWVDDIAIDPPGRRLASGSRDGAVKVWSLGQAQSAPILVESGDENVYAVAFRADGALAWGTEQGRITLWDIERRRALDAPIEGYRNSVLELAFAPKGDRLSSSTHDGTVVV